MHFRICLLPPSSSISMASTSHLLLLNAVLSSVAPKSQLSVSTIESISLLVGSSTMLAALDLLDCAGVARIKKPNGGLIYQITGSNGVYTLYPLLDDSQRRYCPCPAFATTVLADDSAIICKHLLALKIGLRLDCLLEKEFDLKWIAGFATQYMALPPPVDAT